MVDIPVVRKKKNRTSKCTSLTDQDESRYLDGLCGGVIRQSLHVFTFGSERYTSVRIRRCRTGSVLKNGKGLDGSRKEGRFSRKTSTGTV